MPNSTTSLAIGEIARTVDTKIKSLTDLLLANLSAKKFENGSLHFLEIKCWLGELDYNRKIKRTNHKGWTL